MGDGGGDRTRRVLIGIGLGAVGLFTLLSLVPVGLFGDGFANLFPSGNIVGPVGAAVSSRLVGAFGVAAAVVPLFPILWGVWSLGILERAETTRWTFFFAILLALVPPLASALAYPAGGGPVWLAGSYGSWAGGLLALAIGWLGSALLLIVLLVTGVIATLGLAPVKAIARGAGAVKDGTISAGGRARAAMGAGSAAAAWISGVWRQA